MQLNFAKMNPTQNMTIIVNDPVPREKHASIAAQLMAYGSVGAEQVGFREKASLPGARVRLQMMGGEFCGNASMSMAALLAYEDGLADGAATEIPLEVSGADGIVSCRIERRRNIYSGTVDMPLPIGFSQLEGRPAVLFDGIAHAILPASALSDKDAEQKAACWCDTLGMEAMGILLINEDMSAFRPLVYVRETGSAVWEQGCGSGTAAIGAYTAVQLGRNADLTLTQPGGKMRVQTEIRDGIVRRIQISGDVRISAIGSAWIDDASENC